ncbi:serine/threonine-protein kinase [Actinomycetospora sp. NBC_00405]|uniref:serine/threonine-protein kinase n=1 Tax=Actinomycetospora sp. NBC_00405 TaxID=2975952 RepID=UPI002E235EF2
MSTPTSVPSAIWDARATIEPGRRVAGRYLLLAPVGRGGSGSVWRAHDELLDRDVAIKRLHGGHALDESRARQIRDRAHREGRVAARLHHPRLAAIFDMTELDGEVCLVMEYVAAPSLADLLDREGLLPPARVAAIGAQVADGLWAMHGRGIVHRDVKPANIMIGHDDVVTVTDFGIAVVDTDPGTSDQLVAGTPHYMAPELARGGIATAAADVFSLGATLYAALEGAPPAGDGGNALEVLSRVATGHVQPARRAGDLTPVLRSLLDHDPTRRPSAAEAARMLAALAGTPASGPVPAITALAGLSAPSGSVPAVRVASDARAFDSRPSDRQPETDESHTGPIAVPAAVSAALAASRARTRAATSVDEGAGATRFRPSRRVAAVGAGLVGMLGAAGLVAAATNTSDPLPIAAPEVGATPLAAPVPIAAPPVIPAGPEPTTTTTSSSRASAVEDVASSSEASESTSTTTRRSRDADARAAEAWDRWFDRWRAQARADDGDDDRDDDRPRGRARGHHR